MNYKIFKVGEEEVIINLNQIITITEHADHENITIQCVDNIKYEIKMPVEEMKGILGLKSKASGGFKISGLK